VSAYTVWCPDLGSTQDDGRQLTALSPENAAKDWAQREDCDSADYWIVKGDGATVCVADETGAVHTFRVTGEPCIDYYARPAPQHKGT
jgi:hypothetical protein